MATSSNGLNQPAPLLKGSSEPWFYCTGLERVCFLSTEHWASLVGAVPHPTPCWACTVPLSAVLITFPSHALVCAPHLVVINPPLYSLLLFQPSWAYLFRKSPRLCLSGTLHRGSWATGPPLPLWALSMLWPMSG